MLHCEQSECFLRRLDRYFEAIVTLRLDSTPLMTDEDSQFLEAEKGLSIPSKILCSPSPGEMMLSLPSMLELVDRHSSASS